MVKKLWSFDFWIFRHFVAIFRNISAFQNAISFKAVERFKKFFPNLILSRHTLSKLLFGYTINWNLTFSVNLVTSFSRQKPLKLKNKNHTIVWNTKFYHPANIELKRSKTAKVLPRVPLQAFFWPGVIRIARLNQTNIAFLNWKKQQSSYKT